MKPIPTEEFDKIKEIAEKEQAKMIQISAKSRLGYETKARKMIKERLANRIKLGLKNDWKIGFYELKLKRNSAITRKVKGMVKA